jgi:hypothetical protein
MAGQPGSSPVLAERARYECARSMRAIGDESRPPCQYEDESLLARCPAGFLIYTTALGGRGVLVRWKLCLNGAALSKYLSELGLGFYSPVLATFLITS